MVEVRTYERFEIAWDRGSRWSGYQTHQEAQWRLDLSKESGRVVRSTFQVEIPVDKVHLYPTPGTQGTSVPIKIEMR